MKTLLIVRHAKTKQADVGESDFDRTLTDRGRKNALEMAEKILKRKIKIDGFVSSPAKRAMQTCKLFCEALDVKKEKIIYEPSLYEAPSLHYAKVVDGLKNSFDTVAIFGHNGGITDYANTLCNDMFVDNMPTCSVFAVSADIRDWSQFAGATKTFLYFLRPDSAL